MGLTPEQIALAARGFGEQKSITFKTLRKLLDLDPNTRFAGVARDKDPGTLRRAPALLRLARSALREALGDAPWNALTKTPEKLDRIAEVLTFREDINRIRQGLEEIGARAVRRGKTCRSHAGGGVQ